MRRRLLIAALCGALAALGQAPFGLWWVTLLALGGVFYVVAQAETPGRACVLAWVAGSAQFALALSWIVEPFLVTPEVHGWMAPFALVLMAGGLALFWAAPAWLAARAWGGPRARVAALAGGLWAFELVRGVVFTGFPWALLGHVWIGTPADQLAAWGGAPALSGLTLTGAALLALALMRGASARAVLPALASAAVILGAMGAGALRPAAPVPEPRDTVVRLVQPNIPQHLKWRGDLQRDHFQAHLDLSQGADGPADLVLWPETAVPFFLDDSGLGLVVAAQAAGAPILLGIDRRAWGAQGQRQWFNSAALIDTEGSVQAVYDKHHLVPFGEYVPLIGGWAAERGWVGLAARLVSGYTPGPGPQLLDLAGVGGRDRVLPLICYEAVFPRHSRTEQRPDWIAHLTNDAWFGAWIGPYQHRAQTQLRAIETGLPVLRAANTGVSAIIDARGRIVQALDLNTRGAVEGRVPGALPETVYARTGDAPWYGAALALMLWYFGRVWRRRA